MKKILVSLMACALTLSACGGNGAQVACDPNTQDCGQGNGGSHMSPLVAGAIGAGGAALVMHHLHNKQMQNMQQANYGYQHVYHPAVIHHVGSYGYSPARTVVVHHYGSGYASRTVHVYHR